MSDTSPLDLREAHYNTLREEILNTRTRIFRILMVGILGSPILAFFALSPESPAIMVVLSPFVVLLILVLYVSEQASMMRAGQFIREKVEQSEGDWERWLEMKRKTQPEPQLFGMFIMVGMIYYAVLSALALDRIMTLEISRTDSWIGLYKHDFWRFGVPLLYLVATVWVLMTLFRFGKRALHTTD